MRRSIVHVAIVVRDYDEAIEFYTKKLDFTLVEDVYQPEQDKRWVVVAPPGSDGTSLLLAKASNSRQGSFVGNQTGGRVFLFLNTDDFWRDYTTFVSRGIVFLREPKVEAYGTVAVFEDLYGNLWDLLELKCKEPKSGGGSMVEALEVVIEMTERIGDNFRRILEDITAEEAAWRPLPEANSIGLIVRHLSIEAQWHRAALERGEPMPFETTEDVQRAIDSVPVNLEENSRAFEEAYSGFLSALRQMTLDDLRQRTEAAYEGWPQHSRPAHLLGFHQAMHVSMHLGQISSIRNLFQKTRGQPARFFPDNPTFPKGEGG